MTQPSPESADRPVSADITNLCVTQTSNLPRCWAAAFRMAPKRHPEASVRPWSRVSETTQFADWEGRREHRSKGLFTLAST
jgi:hypothetical protein